METHETLRAGIENAPKESLRYDKIIKSTLAQSGELTVRFINGLFDDHIPLDAPVVWLDKETVNDKHTAFVTDFYPKIDGKMYSKEIAQRNLFPVGQFYLRKFEPLTKKKEQAFNDAMAELVTELRKEMDAGHVPFHTGVEMLATVRTIIDNVMKGADKEVDKTVTTNIVETLPWVNYGEVFREIKENLRAEVEAEVRNKVEAKVKAEIRDDVRDEVEAKVRDEVRDGRDMEFASKLFARQKHGANITVLSQTMRELGISDETIEAARKQYEAERSRHSKNRAERER